MLTVLAVGGSDERDNEEAADPAHPALAGLLPGHIRQSAAKCNGTVIRPGNPRDHEYTRGRRTGQGGGLR